jgi:hypothetical protein
MSVSAALDVAIGLAFLFFLFSLAVSRINEYIATVLNLRHKGLENALRAMLNDPHAATAAVGHQADSGSPAAGSPVVLSAEKIMNNALVKPIQQAAKGTFMGGMLGRLSKLGLGQKGISYLPSRTFSAAVLDLLAPPVSNPAHPAAAAGSDPMEEALAAVQRLSPSNPARTPLLRMMTDAQGDRDKFQASLEHWYDDTMDRVSGWYKRYVQKIILMISIVLVASLNVDSVNIAQVLWRLPTERAAVATAAAQQAGSGSSAGQSADQVVRSISALKLPLGWTPPHVTIVGASGATTTAVSTDPQHVPLGVASWLIKVLGLLLTVLALSFGAPFWFDALTKLGSLRQSGPKPAKSARSS